MKISQHMPSFRSKKPESGGLEPTKKDIKAAKKETAAAKKQEKAATKEQQRQASENLPASGYKQRTLGGNIMDTVLGRKPEPTFEMQKPPSNSPPVPRINVTAPTMHSNPGATFDTMPGLQTGPSKSGRKQATTLVPGTHVPPREGSSEAGRPSSAASQQPEAPYSLNHNVPVAPYNQRTLGGNFKDTLLRRPPEPAFDMQKAPSNSPPVPRTNVTAPTMRSKPAATFDTIPGLQVGPGKSMNSGNQVTTLVPGTHVPARGEPPLSTGSGIDQPMGDIPTPPPRRHADNAPRPANLGPAVTRNDITGD